MSVLRFRFAFFGLILLASAALSPASGLAETEINPAVVSPGASAILERAAVRDGGAMLPQATVLAIDAKPSAALAILKKAIALAPEQEDTIRAAVAAAFPDDTTLATPNAQIKAQTAVAAAANAPTTSMKKPAGWGFTSLNGWAGSVELNGSRNTGNTNEATFGVIASFDKEQENWTHHFDGLVDFRQSDGATTKQRFFAGYQLDYKFDGRLYSFGSAQYEDDRFGGFDYRVTENIGLGYIVLSSDRFQWTVEAGPGARHTKHEMGGSMQTEFVGLGNSNFSWVISPSALFEHNFKVFVGSERTTYDTTAGLKVKINGDLSARLSYNVRYDSNVPPGTKNTDTVTRAGLVYDF